MLRIAKLFVALWALALLCSGLAMPIQRCAGVQIGDFRLPAPLYPDPDEWIVESWSDPTRAAQDVVDDPALPNIISTMSGISQNANMDINNEGSGPTDIQIRTFSDSTWIRTLNRYATDATAPPGSGASRIGAMQLNSDLSPIDDYLQSNQLALTGLNLDLFLETSDDFKAFDVLLSYTNPAEGMTLDGISTEVTDNWSTGGAAANYDKLFYPLHRAAAAPLAADFNSDGMVDASDYISWRDNLGASAGAGPITGDANGDDMVDGADYAQWKQEFGAVQGSTEDPPEEGGMFGGSFLVLEKNVIGDDFYPDHIHVEVDILPQFEQGVREFNLIIQSGAFYSFRALSIHEGSGISMETAAAVSSSSLAVPESGTAGLIVLGGPWTMYVRRRLRNQRKTSTADGLPTLHLEPARRAMA